MTDKLREQIRQERHARKDGSGGTWQAHKSANMRRTILEAAMSAIVEHGYARVTTQIIVERAGVSRGAMLHHFPKKQDLLASLVRFIFERRAIEYDTELSKLTDTQRRDEVRGLDIYWQQSSSPSFLAMIELSIAARTDELLANAFNPVFDEVSESRYAAQLAQFPEWENNTKGFEAAADIVRCLMLGLTIAHDIRSSVDRRNIVLSFARNAVLTLRQTQASA